MHFDSIMHSDSIQFLFVFNIVVGMFVVTRDGMGFGWALTDLLMADDTITADRIQTLNQHEQFDFIKLYNQTNQNDFIEDSPFIGNQTSCNYYTPIHSTRQINRYPYFV